MCCCLLPTVSYIRERCLLTETSTCCCAMGEKVSDIYNFTEPHRDVGRPTTPLAPRMNLGPSNRRGKPLMTAAAGYSSKTCHSTLRPRLSVAASVGIMVPKHSKIGPSLSKLCGSQDQHDTAADSHKQPSRQPSAKQNPETTTPRSVGVVDSRKASLQMLYDNPWKERGRLVKRQEDQLELLKVMSMPADVTSDWWESGGRGSRTSTNLEEHRNVATTKSLDYSNILDSIPIASPIPPSTQKNLGLEHAGGRVTFGSEEVHVTSRLEPEMKRQQQQMPVCRSVPPSSHGRSRSWTTPQVKLRRYPNTHPPLNNSVVKENVVSFQIPGFDAEKFKAANLQPYQSNQDNSAAASTLSGHASYHRIKLENIGSSRVTPDEKVLLGAKDEHQQRQREIENKEHERKLITSTLSPRPLRIVIDAADEALLTNIEREFQR